MAVVILIFWIGWMVPPKALHCSYHRVTVKEADEAVDRAGSHIARDASTLFLGVALQGVVRAELRR
jgi:hypothetical protein